jgi:hypothetical protein
LFDDPQVFRTFVLHKILELGDRHRGDDGARRLKARFNVRVFDDFIDLLVQPVDDGLRRAARREKCRPTE